MGLVLGEEIRASASRCGRATGLGYLGVDAVVYEERRHIVMEVSARLGLGIQNVSGAGLEGLLRSTERA
ncbi:MAG: hypothetical protein ACR2JR_01575 [Rubrobacteraceae bacterium]